MTLLAVLALVGAVLMWPDRRAGGRRASGSRRQRERLAPTGRVSVGEVPVAVVIELVAAGLTCGLPPGGAVGAAVRAAGGRTAHDLRPVVDLLGLGAGAEASWARSGSAYQMLARTMLLADRTGAAASAALRRAAADERAARRRRAQVAARRLGVHLVLPLGLATLPAFVLLGVVPVVLGLAGQFLQG